MKMWKTSRKNEIFQVLSGRTNCYLIPSGDGNILVDTGVKSSFGSLRKHIQSMHLVHAKIDFLVLTHTHFDHCQNASKLKREDGSQIIISEKDADFVREGYTPIPEGTGSFTKFLVSIGNKLDHKRFGYEPFEADILIKEKLLLRDDDMKINLINTEGHSGGSISAIMDDDIALVGDALFGVFNNSVFPPFADDIPAMIQSWEKLLDTDCRLFLPGHGKEIKRELLESQYQKYARKFYVV